MTIYLKDEFLREIKHLLQNSGFTVDHIELIEQEAHPSHPTIVTVKVTMEFNGYVKDINEKR